MDNSKRDVILQRIEKTIGNLKRNNMEGYYVERKEDVPAKVAELLHDGDTVTVGGSTSLKEAGVLELLRSGRYHFIDRDAASTPDEKEKALRASFSADAFLCGSNAVTESGKLYNVDGMGGRVSAMTFGPKSVIIVAGYNKLCKDVAKAAVRVKSMCAPANAKRLSCQTYCAEHGECVSFSKDEGDHISSGCSSPGRICCTYVITAQQRIPGRIKVILVGEELGY